MSSSAPKQPPEAPATSVDPDPPVAPVKKKKKKAGIPIELDGSTAPTKPKKKKVKKENADLPASQSTSDPTSTTNGLERSTSRATTKTAEPEPASAYSPSTDLSRTSSSNPFAETARGESPPRLPASRRLTASEAFPRTLSKSRTLASSSDIWGSEAASTSPKPSPKQSPKESPKDYSKNLDHTGEIAELNDKLLSATLLQTKLEDTAATAKHDLETARARIQYLEAQAKSHKDKVAGGLLLKKLDVDAEKLKLNKELTEEKRQKETAMREKKAIDMELETLTASLFEEANKMVSSANIEREALEKKNRYLQDQIKDIEALLASQNNQLLELKQVMSQMGPDKTKGEDGSTHVSDSPPTPVDQETNVAKLLEVLKLSPLSTDLGNINASPSTTFTHLMKAVCRTDLPAYDDFRNFISTYQKNQVLSRANGTTNGQSFPALTLTPSQSSATNRAPPATSPNLNTSPNPPLSPNPNDAKLPPVLKETKFFKRLLLEDIEPTLRLDLSPNISWLSRRSIITALTDGTLVVEPIPYTYTMSHGRHPPCAMCGEERKTEHNTRTHRMQVGEGESGSRWNLCKICVEKIRSVGDMVAYVRMVRDGVIKCRNRGEEREAWEELVKLRERLFWARMAAGVVPAFLLPPKEESTAKDAAPRTSQDSIEIETVEPPPNVTRVALPRSATETPMHNNPWSSGSESAAGSVIQEEVDYQLHQDLHESLTTFDNIKKIRPRTTSAPVVAPVVTPVVNPAAAPAEKKRDSGGFLKLAIPPSFWSGEVNVLR